MSFLRKASLSRKKDREGSASPKSSAIRGERPPRVELPSAEDGLDASNSKRKPSLSGKGRRRLSSFFSSNSLSSYTSDKDPNSSPSISRQSNLNPSTSTSGASTPAASVSPNGKYTSLDSKGSPSTLVNGVQTLSLDAKNGPLTSANGPLTQSPDSSPTVTAPANPILAPSVTSVSTPPREASIKQPRPASLYSQWDLADAAEDSSDEEDEAFLTPDEGLSEVEEEDEEDEEPVVKNPTLDATNVEKGAKATGKDVSGTGLSTVRRSKPAQGETRVRKRAATSKVSALEIDQAALLAPDLESCRQILTLFLTSQMKKAEDMCFDKDPDGNHLYLISAHGIINALKGMMTFDSADLTNALDICKATSVTASALRKPSDSLVSRLGGLVRSGAGVQRVKQMTPLERHAELVYAETALMKAMLAIIAGGDWLGLVREALNMRTAHGIYRVLQQYLEEADKNGFDEDIDMDFRSGVLLGTGTSSLMLSLLPGKVLKIAEVFGYGGDRKVALDTLMAAGGWTRTAVEPAYNESNEGIRRPVCDMILLSFHLVISVLMPVDGVDIPVARNILAYNVKRYPDGVFFLYFQARLHTTQCEPELAIQSLQKALDLQLEYVQLQHMCLVSTQSDTIEALDLLTKPQWDYAVNYLQLNNWKGSLDCFTILREESNWSRAVYTYCAAACLVELYQDGDATADLEEAENLMRQVPKLTKKIAGKSLPIEKLVARKCRKFESQGRRLFLPALELTYVFGAMGHCPRHILLGKHLPRIDAQLAILDKVTPEQYGNGHEYWDDYCLGHFLRGVVQSVARYQVGRVSRLLYTWRKGEIAKAAAQPPDAAPSATVPIEGQMSEEEMDKGAEKDFQAVLRHGPDVELDHFIVYHCHYELGRLYARRGDKEQAKHNFDVVMSGKLLEVNHHEKKAQGKYSLEGALLLKTHAALQGLNKGQVV